MTGLVQDFARVSGVVGETGRRQRYGLGPIGARQPFAIERVPDRFVEQSGGVAAHDDGVAKMEMVCVRPREND